MSALTSLLVRDRVVPVSKIEEALQSQVFLGGDLEIILLEMNLVPEDVLSAYRAALFNLLPATREEVMRASRDALRRMSPEVARAVGMVPLLFEKRTLVVAAWEPIYEPRLGELESQLGCDLSVRIVNGARLAAGLAHQYGFELDPRLRRLADALRRRDPGVVPYVHPPTPSMRPSMPPPAVHDDDDDDDDDAPEPEARPPGRVSAPSPAPVAEAPADDDAYVDLEAERAATPRGVSPELVHLVRPPFSYEAALDLLQRVSNRDDVLFVLLRWVQQFFGFTCIFGVGREGISARMAHGNGLPPDVIEQAFIETPRTGLLAQAVRQGRAMLGNLGDAHEEHAAAELLQRPAGRVGLALPVALSGRVVLLVYVDDAREALTLEHAELLAPLLPAVNEALYRIILEHRNQRIAESLHRDPLPDAPSANQQEEASAEAPTARMAIPPEGNLAAPTTTLRAVDLDALDRSDEVEGDAAPHAPTDAPDATRLRERLPGVPRPAPAPPAYAPSRAVGSYAQGGAAGLAEQRVDEAASAEPAPLPAPEPAVQVAPAVALNEDAPPAPAPDTARGRASVVDLEDQPSVIIDMGESVDALVDALEKAPPDVDPPEIAELLALGEGALPVLVQRFPGPLWFDRHKPHRKLPASRDVSAVARTMVAFGDRAAPYLASLLGDDDPERCYHALLVARDVTHPELVEPIARRLLDRDRQLRTLAVEVLRGYAGAPQYDAVLRALADLAAQPSREAGRQQIAVEALGVLRDGRALATLLACLRDRDTAVVQAAHRALVVLTGHDFGASPRKWESWAEGWGRAHRVEWLIEALLHNDESVRGQAGEELKRLTQQYFGYHPAMPRRDRELSQRKYREWWELEGRVAFGR
ncbi:MAG: hypothetical protein ABW252_13480 [Polyangiales bacterium]